MAGTIKSSQKRDYFVGMGKLVEEQKSSIKSSLDRLKDVANVIGAEATDEIYNRVVTIANAYIGCMNDTLTFAVDGLTKLSKSTIASSSLAEECGSLKNQVSSIREQSVNLEMITVKRTGDESLTDENKEEFGQAIVTFITLRSVYIHELKRRTMMIEDQQFLNEVGLPVGKVNEKCANQQVVAYKAIKKQLEVLGIAIDSQLNAMASGVEDIKTNADEIESVSKVTDYGEI